MTIRICDICGEKFDEEEIDNCNWCGKDLCLKHEQEHDCINNDD